MQARVRTLNAEGKTDNEIAAMLVSEGYRTTKGGQINDVSVYRRRKRWGIRANRQYEDGRNPQKWEDETYSVQGAATVIGGAGEAWLTELSTAQLRKLFALRKDAVGE